MSECSTITDLDIIMPAIEAVPYYTDYGSGRSLGAHLERLSEDAPRKGIHIEREPIGEQRSAEGLITPHIQTTIRIGEGYSIGFKGGVHGNELVEQRSQHYLGELAWRAPDFLRRLGIGEITMYGDRTTADLNTWHYGQRTLYGYFRGMHRSRHEADWDYPATYRGLTHVSTVPACIASQQVIAQKKFDSLLSGHNGAVGSYYNYVMGAPESLPPVLSRFMRRIYGGPPMTPDIPMAKELAPGVYQLPEWEEVTPLRMGEDVENLEALRYGCNSLHFADRCAKNEGRLQPIGNIAEPAYFKAHALADTRLSGINDRTLSVQLARKTIDAIGYVEKQIKQIGIPDQGAAYELRTDLIDAVDMWNKLLEPAVQEAEKRPDTELTNSGVAQAIIRNYLYRTLLIGNLANLSAMVSSPHQETIDIRLKEETSWFKETLDIESMAPSTLVQAHIGTLLLSALHLPGRT